MDINELITKHKNKIIQGLLILLVIYIAVGIFKKQAQELVNIKANRENELKKNSATEQLQKAQGQLLEYKKYVNKKDINSTMNTLTNIAQVSGVKIISVKPLAERVFVQHSEYPFNLKIEAESYHQLGRFISRLESNPDIYNVQSAHITPQGSMSAQGEIKVSADLEICTYWVKEK